MSDANDQAGSSSPPADDAPRKRSKPAIAPADFVSRLVSDPANPPQTTLLTGYPGASDEENHTRIYFDPELRDYVDVPNDDILHTQPGGEGAVEPSLIWIRQDAQVLHGQAAGDRQRAGFFEGRVWQDNFAATAEAGAGPGAGAAAGAVSAGVACRPTALICPSVVAICRTAQVICRPVVSRQIRCPVASPWCGPLPWTRVDPNITETLGNPTINRQPGFGAFEGSDWGTDTIHQGAADFTDTIQVGRAGVGGPSIASPCGPSAFIACRPSIVNICRTSPVICRHIPSVHVRCPVASPWCGPLPWTRVDPNITETLGNPTINQQPGFAAFEGSDWGTDTIHQGAADFTDTIQVGRAGAGGPSIASPCAPSAFIACRPSIVNICRTSPVICRHIPSVHVRCPVASPWCGPLPWTRVDPNITETLGNPTINRQPGFGAFEGSDWGTDTIHQGSGDWTDTIHFGDAGGGGFGAAATAAPQCFAGGPTPHLAQTVAPQCLVDRTRFQLATRDVRCIRFTRDFRCVATGHNCPSWGFCPTDRFDPTIFQNQTIFQNRQGFG